MAAPNLSKQIAQFDNEAAVIVKQLAATPPTDQLRRKGLRDQRRLLREQRARLVRRTRLIHYLSGGDHDVQLRP